MSEVIESVAAIWVIVMLLWQSSRIERLELQMAAVRAIDEARRAQAESPIVTLTPEEIARYAELPEHCL